MNFQGSSLLFSFLQKVYTIKYDFNYFTNTWSATYNITDIEEVYKELTDMLKNAKREEAFVLSDLFEPLSGGKCIGRYGHKSEYFRSDKKISSEAFAHFFSASVLDNEVKLNTIKDIFPTAYKEFLKIIGDMK